MPGIADAVQVEEEAEEPNEVVREPDVAWRRRRVAREERVEEHARGPGEDLFACSELRELSWKWLCTEHENIEYGTAVDDGASEITRKLFGQQ